MTRYFRTCFCLCQKTVFTFKPDTYRKNRNCNFSELRMIFNKSLLGLPPTMVLVLFSSGLTREMLTREMIKVCIYWIITTLYWSIRGVLENWTFKIKCDGVGKWSFNILEYWRTEHWKTETISLALSKKSFIWLRLLSF